MSLIITVVVGETTLAAILFEYGGGGALPDATAKGIIVVVDMWRVAVLW